ncbi:hypothetical protein ASPBRDRAFT_422230 [Aspergillus brasiliensis CBS 101740]|uniref:Uncharacterized protein n=1 Tax=Aspergillus brasiliensis (strain CBS 101740 / IMI 381727 / IBT 21946) TaxID=767769 RepID=A0A1L9U4N0_ASPBC|nr:hypothetical protein ASPBRDRAFT_422230 [Aspergillus brasiliensis CBS 101740]
MRYRPTRFRVTLALVHSSLEPMDASPLEVMSWHMRRQLACFSARAVVKSEWLRYRTPQTALRERRRMSSPMVGSMILIRCSSDKGMVQDGAMGKNWGKAIRRMLRGHIFIISAEAIYLQQQCITMSATSLMLI